MYLPLTLLVAICMSEYWTAVFQNAIGCAIGSAVAIAISVLIYWLTNRHNNQVAEREQLTEQKNMLEAFKSMLQRVIHTSNILVANIGEFIPKLERHPNVFPVLTITSFGHFKRIIETTTFEKTGVAYVKLVPGKKSIDEFTSMLEIIDFLNDAFNEMREIAKTASLNHEERIFKVSDLYEGADKLLIDNIEILGNQSMIIQKAGQIKENFLRDKSDQFNNVDDVYNLYFLPMRDLMETFRKNGIMNEFIRKFTYSIYVGIEYYTYLALGYDKFILEMKGIENAIKIELAKLDGLAGSLKSFV
jgi:hypothetical protein